MNYQKKTIILLLTSLSLFIFSNLTAQEKKERLDFAKTNFELGNTYYPSFDGKRLQDDELTTYENPASLNPVLYWGGFHFWGKAEFNVSFPLARINLSDSGQTDVGFTHTAITGARYYPWTVQEKKLRPFVGLSWSAFDYTQKVKDGEDMPRLSKNFSLNIDAGLLYCHKHFAFRVGANYHPDNKWKYPISKTEFATVRTPNYGINLGLIYTYDSSSKPEGSKVWNDYPTVSPLGYQAKTFGDFSIGAGPSSSFSLQRSEYNDANFPYLNPRITAELFFDYTVGYQLNKWNMFTALTYRNPKFKREGFGINQTINKKSLVLEVNKFLTDYTGFAPFIGLGLSYDNIKYQESENDTMQKELTHNQYEPAVTFGWDIVPGKTNESIILRTNLRWFPLSSFNVEGEKFNFSQLEYNFIQVVFYPQRLPNKKNK